MNDAHARYSKDVHVLELKANLASDRSRFDEYSFNDKRSLRVMDSFLKIFELYHANHTDDEYKIFEAGWIDFLRKLAQHPTTQQQLPVIADTPLLLETHGIRLLLARLALYA
jgi:hypothetical protein